MGQNVLATVVTGRKQWLVRSQPQIFLSLLYFIYLPLHTYSGIVCFKPVACTMIEICISVV